MGELGALFNPGMRHELEERQAKASRREEEGNARDGDLRIDLESGVAVINIPGEDAAEAVPAGTSDSQGTAEATDEAPQASGAALVSIDSDGQPTDADAQPTATADEADAAEADAAEAEAAEPAAPAALRPRGKRGLPASHR